MSDRVKRKTKVKAKANLVKTIFDRPIMLHVCKDGTVTYRDKRKREKVFNGVALPVFSVNTVEEAKQIQIRFCRLMYARHPDPKGPEDWYVLNTFSGELDDLDRVMAEFATFYAEHVVVMKEETQRMASKLRYAIVDKLKRRAGGVE